MRMAVVGAPSYFTKRSAPKKPQDLTDHNCINLRLPTHGGLYAWEFEKGGRELKVRVDGQLVFNGTTQMLNAALAGFGLAYVPEDAAQPASNSRTVSSECSTIGARLFRDTISIIRAAAIPPRHFPCWSMRCATGVRAAEGAAGEGEKEYRRQPERAGMIHKPDDGKV